jgi:hypothetical protein
MVMGSDLYASMDEGRRRIARIQKNNADINNFIMIVAIHSDTRKCVVAYRETAL